MPYEFTLPDLGEGIVEVELRKWLVREGDTVAEHQGVLEVETDKAVVEAPAPRSGIITRLHHHAGELVTVGTPLFTIATEGEAPPPAPRPAPAGIVGILPQEEDMAPSTVKDAEGRGEGPLRVSPLARRLARQRGLDLRDIRGSGPHGTILPEDLDQAPPSPDRDESPGERVPLRGVRRAIARAVLDSQRRTAFVTGMEEADITDLCELRNREQQEAEARGTHLTLLPFFMKAAQHALRHHPYLNAAIDDDAEVIILKKHFHFGIAVETPDGLMVPVIRHVDRKSILQLAEEIHHLGQKARERTIDREELRGSSFTLTNFGHFGGTFATPIINWPDVAILGCGRVVQRPWVHDGTIAIRSILPLSLTFDHRVTDGADAALFLTQVVRYLEDPGLLFIESA